MIEIVDLPKENIEESVISKPDNSKKQEEEQ